MEENSSNNVTTKQKGKKKIVLIVIAIIVVMLLGVNAFASVSGYGNVFFMIKNIVSTGTLSGEDEIFSDEEITLSYKSIEVADGVKVQINKLEIKENESTLCLTVKADEENKVLPLKFSLKSEGLREREIKVEDATQKSGEFEERLNVNYKFSPDELMTLYIKDKDGNLLREIEINLYSREIFVKGDDYVEKISQIELKKYLNVFSELNNGSDVDNKLLEMADEIWINVLDKKDTASREVTNQIVKEFYGEKAEFTKAKDANGKEVEVVKYGQAWTYGPYDGGTDYIYMTTADFSEYQQGICLNIKDISYEDGIYTVDYIYTLATYYDIDDEKIEELPQYEAIIKLKLNEDAKYSKYQVVEFAKNEMISEAKEELDVVKPVETELTNHEHNYVVVENPGNDYHTTLDGEHKIVCSVCGDERAERHNFDKWYDIGGGAYTLWCKDCKRYVYTTDESLVKNSGYGINSNGHQHKYQVIENPGNDYHTTLDGEHKIVCSVCGDERAERHNFDKWYDIGGGAYTLWCKDCKRYVYTTDESLVKNSGYGINSNGHQHKYQVIENPGNDYHTTLDGEHKTECSVCGAIGTEKHNFDEWYDIGGAWTLWCKDCKRYVYTTDENVVMNSGYGIKK